MNGTKNARTGIYMMLTVMLVSITRRLPGTKNLSERLSTGMTTLVLAAVVMLVAAGGASAEYACVDNDDQSIAYFCGDTVMTSCTLNGSMTCPAGAPGLIAGAPNIVINGNGFKMTGTVAGANCWAGFWSPYTAGEGNPAKHSGIWIDGGLSGVVVQDLEIEEFCTGVALGACTNATVDGCNIHNNGGFTGITHGIHLAYADHCNIKRNTICNNLAVDSEMCGCGGSGNGIFSYGGDGPGNGDWNNFTCNLLCDNTKAGFHMKKKCMDNRIEYNNVTGNGIGGIVLRCMMSNRNKVLYNTVTDNFGTGIYIRGHDNLFRWNTVTGNMNDSPYKDTCKSKPAGAVCKNGVGFRVQSDSGVATAYNNTACDNDFLDIEDNSVAPKKLTGDENTCANCAGYVGDGGAGANQCDWKCEELVDVYYDYDNDWPIVDGGSYSKNWAVDACQQLPCLYPTLMAVGSCCNPGLFNGTGAQTPHCDYDVNSHDVCILTEGTDPNDCCPVPELMTFTLFGLGLVGLLGYIKTRKD